MCCYFRPRQLPSIEEAWRLPIPAELTSRQSSAPGAPAQQVCQSLQSCHSCTCMAGLLFSVQCQTYSLLLQSCQSCKSPEGLQRPMDMLTFACARTHTHLDTHALTHTHLDMHAHTPRHMHTHLDTSTYAHAHQYTPYKNMRL